MTISHKNIADADLHEPKGVSGATSGMWYIANGSGSGVWKDKIKTYQATLTPTSVSNHTTAEQTFTFTGVEAADFVLGVSKPTAQAGLGIVGQRITATNTVGITFVNSTTTPITPTATEIYTILVYKA